MLLKGRILTTLSSLRTAYSSQLAAVLPETGRIDDATGLFLKAVCQASRAPFSAQPAYASDEDNESEITLEPRPITPETRYSCLKGWAHRCLHAGSRRTASCAACAGGVVCWQSRPA